MGVVPWTGGAARPWAGRLAVVGRRPWARRSGRRRGDLGTRVARWIGYRVGVGLKLVYTSGPILLQWASWVGTVTVCQAQFLVLNILLDFENLETIQI
jgi:hypothetical protein